MRSPFLASGATAFDYLDNTPFRMNSIILLRTHKPFSRVWFHDLISHKGLCDLRCNRSVLMQWPATPIARVNTQQVQKTWKNQPDSRLLARWYICCSCLAAKHQARSFVRGRQPVWIEGGQLISGGSAMGLFSTNSAGNDQLTRVAATPQLLAPQETPAMGDIRASFGAHDAKSTGRLRSIVERRFRRMFDAHDRIRTELLASHLTHTK